MSEEAASVRLEMIERVAWIYERLAEVYGLPQWRPTGDALGELVATILSQHTSDVNSERAYKQLRERFPAWEAIRDAPVEEVAEAIRSGGLAEVKAERIQCILDLLTERLGAAPLSLDFLAALPMDEANAYLRTLPGVGPKTAACVLLFALGKPAFPVDTHVWRVTRRLGLIGAKVSADAAHVALERIIPPGWRYVMHINLIRHGRRICTAQRPACERCPLRAGCAYYWEVVAQATE
jgi:endonuclease III